MIKQKFICVCGKIYFLYTNYKKEININICCNCHPYYSKNIKKSNFSTIIKNFNKKYEIYFKK